MSFDTDVLVIGAGRAGRSVAKAIDDLVDWDVIDMRGRGVAIDDAAADVGGAGG